jgi:hypothetical protein
MPISADDLMWGKLANSLLIIIIIIIIITRLSKKIEYIK